MNNVVRSAFSETLLRFDVGLDVPVEFVLPCMILLILGVSDFLHLVVVIEVPFVVAGYFLPQIDGFVLC